MGEEAVSVGCCEIHVSLYVFIAIPKGFVVAVEEVEFPGDDGYGACPVKAVVSLVLTSVQSPAIRRYDVGKHSVGKLRVTVVGHPFFVKGESVKVVEPCLDGYVGVSRPAVLFPLGAVGRIADQV